MAGNSNLTVSVSADVTDLQTKLALAQSEMTKNSAALRKLANDYRKAGDDVKSGLLPGLQAASAATAGTKIAVSQLSAEFQSHIPKVNAAAAAHKQMGGIIGQNRVAFASLEHSARAMVDSVASGRNPLQAFGQEAARIAQALTEFNTVSIGTIARFGGITAVVVGGIAALAEYYQHLVRLRAEASLSTDLGAMGLKTSTADIHEMSDELRRAGYTMKEVADLTSDERLSMVRSFSEIRLGGTEMTRALIELVPGFAQVFGITAAQAVEKLKTDMNDLTGSGSRTMESLHLTTGELAQFQDAAAKDPKQGIILYLNHLRTAADTATNSIENAANQSRSFLGMLAEQGDSINRALHGDFSSPTRQQKTQATNAQSDANLKTAESQLPTNLAPDSNAIQEQLTKQEQDTAKTHTQIIAEQTAYLKAILDNDRLSGSERVALNKRYEELIYEGKTAGSAEELEIVQTNARKAASAAGASRTSELAAQRAVLEAGLNDEKLTADAKLELRKQLAQLELRDVRAGASEAKKSAEEAWHEYVAGIEEQIAAEKGHFDRQIALIQQWVAKAKSAYGENSVNYKEALKKLDEVDNERTESAKRAAEQQATAAKDMAEAQANLDKIGAKSTTGEFKPSIGLAFDESKLDGEVAAQVAHLKQAFDTDMAGLKAKINVDISLGDKGAVAADYKQLTADAAAYANSVQEVNARAAAAVQASWDKITQPIGNAFDQILSAATSRNEGIGRAAEKAAEGLVMSFAKAGLKQVADWAAHEVAMTFSTQANVAARTAANNTGQLSTIAELGQTVAKFLGFETAKTAATTAGNASRTASDVAGVAAGKAAQVASNVSSVTGDAGVAAAGAFAATAAIPIVGPSLAPGAASAAYASTIGFLPVASAEGGWDRVPFDGAPAVLHKNEMVLPASLAQGVRNMTQGGMNLPRGAQPGLGGTSSTVNSSGDTSHTQTINHSPTINAPGASSSDIAGLVRQSHRELKSMMYQTSKNWAGRGAHNQLAGRR